MGSVSNRGINDPINLKRRLCHALDIASQTVTRLAITGYADPANPENHLRPEKIISETALLLYAASAVGPQSELQPRIRLLGEQLLPHARSERILLGICIEPTLAWDYGLAHVLLKELGFKDPAFDAALAQAAQSQVQSGRERTPYRTLEQEWIKEIWTGSRIRKTVQRTPAGRNSALGKSIDLLSGTREDIYAFTHALMYVTDFNLFPKRLPRSRRAIHSDAEAALAFCLDEQDYDLGGEVLLTWPLTAKTWSPAAAFGLRVVMQVEDRAGFLPSPGTRLDRLNSLQGDERTNYLLATAYHTAYVMGLLCAAALQEGRTPPAKISTRHSRPGSAKMVLRFLDDDGPRQHWRETIEQLEDREQDAIAGLLMNIGLRRKVKQRDFGGLHQLLATGYQCGLANSPAASQAAEILERLSVFAAKPMKATK